MSRFLLGIALLFAGASQVHAQTYPAPESLDHILKNFKFSSGESLPEIRMHYRTFGKPARDDKGVVRNAILILHGTTGEGGNFIRDIFAGELFGKGQLLDATKYYIIIPDNIGHGKSSKPSDGLRAKFPKFGYHDMIAAQHRLLTEGLKVDHLRLVMGTSMGGMHTWLWGQKYPEFMAALMPLASLPSEISGRNRVWRKMIIDAIRTDPEWKDGNYTTQPRGLRTAAEMLYFMAGNPLMRQKDGPTLKESDAAPEQYVETALKRLDANDVLYAVESSFDYDPGKGLEKINAPLFAVNFADDLINPPELGILEKEISRVPKGRAVVMPLTPDTVGHGTHTKATVWKHHLEKLLNDSTR